MNQEEFKAFWTELKAKWEPTDEPRRQPIPLGSKEELNSDCMINDIRFYSFCKEAPVITDCIVF
jgi:hypothetical protein